MRWLLRRQVQNLRRPRHPAFRCLASQLYRRLLSKRQEDRNQPGREDAYSRIAQVWFGNRCRMSGRRQRTLLRSPGSVKPIAQTIMRLFVESAFQSRVFVFDLRPAPTPLEAYASRYCHESEQYLEGWDL